MDFEPCAPLLCLRINGLFCPCIEGEDQRATRIAEVSLKSVPIRWYRKLKTKANEPNKLLEDITNRLGCTGDKIEEDEGQVAQAQAVQATQSSEGLPVAPVAAHDTSSAYIAIDATLDVIDTIHGPAIQVVSNEYNFIDDEDTYENTQKDDFESDPVTESQTSRMTKTILFTGIEFASQAKRGTWSYLGLGGDYQHGVFVHSAAPPGSPPSSGKKLLIFEVVQQKLHSLASNEAVRHLNTVISWNRTRVENRAFNKGNKDSDSKTAGETLPDETLDDHSSVDGKSYPTHALMDNEEGEEKNDKEEEVKKKPKAKVSKHAEVRMMEKRQGVVIIH